MKVIWAKSTHEHARSMSLWFLYTIKLCEDALQIKCLLARRTQCSVACISCALQNSLNEYYAMINWVSPGLMGTDKEFEIEFAHTIQKGESYCLDRRLCLWPLQFLVPKQKRVALCICTCTACISVNVKATVWPCLGFVFWLLNFIFTILRAAASLSFFEVTHDLRSLFLLPEQLIPASSTIFGTKSAYHSPNSTIQLQPQNRTPTITIACSASLASKVEPECCSSTLLLLVS